MIGELVSAFLLVFLAEMGDKTQILAMMFAAKYKAGAVLIGIIIGSLCNHGLAVLIGVYLGDAIPVMVLGSVAGLTFLYFAFTSLKYEEIQTNTMRKYQHPVYAVAIAFFIGELGDKTQLSAITLAMDTKYPWAILIGTVGAMAITGIIGIGIGNKIGKKISPVWVKLFSACLFLIFGMAKLIVLFKDQVDVFFILLEVMIIGFAFILTVAKFRSKYRIKN